MLLFYTPRLSPRLRYVARYLIEDLLGLELRFCHDKEEYLQSTLPKINYSRDPLQSGIFLRAARLLFDTEIFPQEIKGSQHRGAAIFFLTAKPSQLPFDPFAASFYLMSRYEEYIPFIADVHQRFPAEQSLMMRLEALDQPLVNIYAQWLGELLQEHNYGLALRKPEYRFLPTVDIDNSSAYLGKGIFRVIGGFAKDLLALRFGEMWQRSQSLLGLKPDPFDTFEYVLDLQERFQIKVLYFALYGRMGQYDRSLSRHSPLLQRYLKGISDFSEVGLHPSYRSNEAEGVLEEELLSLEKLLRKDVNKSRQHFIKLHFPKTYRQLIELGIQDDYSMGFTNICGFRAGVCTPFRFYDLEQEIETPLRLHPFPFMDGTFIYYLQKSPDKAWPEIEKYIEIYRRFGGEFTPIWHNRVFSEKDPEWKGWNAVFEKMIAAAR